MDVSSDWRVATTTRVGGPSRALWQNRWSIPNKSLVSHCLQQQYSMPCTDNNNIYTSHSGNLPEIGSIIYSRRGHAHEEKKAQRFLKKATAFTASCPRGDVTRKNTTASRFNWNAKISFLLPSFPLIGSFDVIHGRGWGGRQRSPSARFHNNLIKTPLTHTCIYIYIYILLRGWRAPWKRG